MENASLLGELGITVKDFSFLENQESEESLLTESRRVLTDNLGCDLAESIIDQDEVKEIFNGAGWENWTYDETEQVYWESMGAGE